MYFSAEITQESAASLIQKLREIDDATPRWARIQNAPIELVINSYGGDAFSALGATDMIASLLSPVRGLVAGAACSSGSLLLMGCTHRLMTANSFLLIHQLSGFVYGTHEKFKDEVGMQKKFMQRMIALYADRSKLTRREVREMLKRETWMTAEEALKAGLVDAILE